MSSGFHVQAAGHPYTSQGLQMLTSMSTSLRGCVNRILESFLPDREPTRAVGRACI